MVFAFSSYLIETSQYKNTMKQVFTLSFFCLAAYSVSAQSTYDIYNFSNSSSMGTARSIGFGSTLGSIGGDFSALSVNPAGIGVYRKSEFSFTPSLKVGSSTSQYLGNSADDNDVRFNINNFGVVFTNAPKGKRYERREWKAVSFGLGINRIADFNKRYTYRGINNNNSAAQSFEADANIDTSFIPDGSLGYLGIASGLIGRSGNELYSIRVPYQGGIEQVNSIKERGGINEFVISFGGNYKERLLLGATLGIPILRYQRESNYTENIIASNTNNPYGFQTFSYNQDLKTNGAGVNLKVGAILKLTNFLRIGAALHTPTALWVRDHEDYSLSSRIGGTSFFESTADYLGAREFDYTVITPAKGVLSASIVIKKVGFITADYEYLNYKSMRFIFPDGTDNLSGSSYSTIASGYNQTIKDTYKGASNFRLGAEILLAKNFMIRGGVGYYQSPYAKETLNYGRLDLSGGVGFRSRGFFADLGFVNRTSTTSEYAYQFDYSLVRGNVAAFPQAITDHSITNMALTVGTKF